MAKIGLFIPCYNVEGSIGQVLASFPEDILSRVDQVVTIDNCSRDNTVGVLEKIQASRSTVGKKLVILKNKANYGIGGSLKIAARYFLDNQFTHYFIIHSDNQGNGGEIARLFFEAFDAEPDVDYVMASRFSPEADLSRYSRPRRWGNHFFNFMTFLLTGHKMSDAGTGILLINTRILPRIPFEDLDNGFQWNPEVNILLFNLGDLKIRVVPLSWRDSEVGSNVREIRYCLTLLAKLVRYRWNKSVLKKQGWQLFYKESQRRPQEFIIGDSH